MGAKLLPGEAERRRKERQRRAFSGEGGPRYDPLKEGYGHASQWRQAAGEGFTFVDDPEPVFKPDADLAALGLKALPDTAALLTQAYRLAAKLAHPDVGGTHAAFVALGQVYERLKRRM